MNTILLFVLPAALGLAQISDSGLSFDQLAQTALTQNKSLQAAREQLRQAEARLTQAGLRPNPSLDISRSTDVIFGNEGENGFAVVVSQPFETGGKRTKRMRVAEAEVEVIKAEIADAERQLTGQLKTAYLAAIETAARLNSLERTRGISQQMVQVMNVRLTSGDASRLDSHLLLAENNRVEAQRLQAESRLTGQLLEIRRFAGLSPNATLSLKPVVPAASIVRDETALVEMALRSRPDLQAARLREALSDAGVALARSQAAPNITGSVRYAREPNVSRLQPRAFDKESVLDFGISIPLPFSNREQGNIREASSKVVQARTEREALEHAIRIEVAIALGRYQSASRSLELIRGGIVQEAEEGVRITQLAYRLGSLRLVDVLFQQRSLLDSQIAELSAQAEITAAHAALEFAVGMRLN